MVAPNKILEEALTLTPAQKAELIDKLLSRLDKPDREIDDITPDHAGRIQQPLRNVARIAFVVILLRIIYDENNPGHRFIAQITQHSLGHGA